MAKKQKVALITGITGQDGAYLADLLLSKHYIVHGIKRRSSQFNTQRIDHLYQEDHIKHQNFFLHYGDLNDSNSLVQALAMIKPHEIYNLGAQSHVRISFDMPEYTIDVNALGTQRMLDAIRIIGIEKETRFYQATSSEIYGNASDGFLTETHPFQPCSPYAISKLAAYWSTRLYRESYGIFASNGILFNHESPLRAETFVTRKIVRGVAAIKHGKAEALTLGNLNAYRDWGHAKDYVEAMWLILQHSIPDDFVIATGEHRSVRWFVESAFNIAGYKIIWEGKGLQEVGKDSKTAKVLVNLSERYYRPSEVHSLLGDASKAKKELGWKAKYTVEQLVAEMMEAELRKNA